MITKKPFVAVALEEHMEEKYESMEVILNVLNY